ncbi:hypothetical protein BOTBODRAFT_35944 [Botryobasidium botryosum FD-172 SS1]|uniref:Helicase ATP-binding domain-containing protein n=1 Tax=Botryobasidium botryosum (strain FD-172 SS1) TaxID=930990 RepID=A0A067M5N8_BOTB1|nr:hypothetical protein BOTBODRAFT_35944 [Botryobasidium botryosum FD-172 SS1]
MVVYVIDQDASKSRSIDASSRLCYNPHLPPRPDAPTPLRADQRSAIDRITMSASNVSSTAVATPCSSPSGDPHLPAAMKDKCSIKDEDGEYEEGTVESAPAPPPESDPQRRLDRLNFLLEKSTIFATILAGRMGQITAEPSAKAGSTKAPAKSKAKSKTAALKGKKRTHQESDNEDEPAEKRNKPNEPTVIFEQPPQIVGKLKDYQLQGVQWMVRLWENGLNGILADEMGLGQTLQTISFLAYLQSRGIWGPFLIVCPLSVLHNWVSEFERFTPTIPVVAYHGTPTERAELRRKVLVKKPPKNGAQIPRFPIVVTTYEMIIKDSKHLGGDKFDWKYVIVDEGHRLKNMDSKLMKEIKTYSSSNRMILTGTPLHNNLGELWSLLNFILPDIFDDLDSFQQWFNFTPPSGTAESESASDPSALNSAQSAHIVHSLHAILKPFLLRRLKVDVESTLPPKKEYVLYAPLTLEQKELYEAVIGGRVREWLINKLGESIEDGKKDEGEEGEEEGEGRKLRGLRKRVIYHESDEGESEDEEWMRKVEEGELDQGERKAKKRGKAKEKGGNGGKGGSTTGTTGTTTRKWKEEETAAQLGKKFMLAQALKTVNNMKLQNMIMQCRKVCSHPFLFSWPIDQATGELVVNDELVNVSGKMLLLDRLLSELIRRKHKVLLFSQFVTMLDVIEEWAEAHKGWTTCRIDGSTSQADRRAQMKLFNEGGEKPDACRLFLLSTRAGGLGINLVAADTVIFYDQDWNPQMDLQAQDRAHRIGQTRPVLIFRLVANHTVETKIMSKASEKRKLEALVIAKGKFKLPTAIVRQQKQESIAEMATALLKLEGEKIEIVSHGDNVISDADLDVLLDRRPEVFAERGIGWGKAEAEAEAEAEVEDAKEAVPAAAGDKKADKKDKSKLAQRKKEGGRTAFEVYQRPVDEGNDGLAHMLGEDA